MQDRWAALLLSASKGYEARHLTFVDILSRLSSDELNLLEEVCFSYKSFPEISYPGGHFEENHNKLVANANILVSGGATPGMTATQAYLHFVDASPLSYGRIMHARSAFP
jgi:hypothetical protein